MPLALLTDNGATTMRLGEEYGLEVGRPANFIVLDARSTFDAVYERADVVMSVWDGHRFFTASTTVESSVPLLAVPEGMDAIV